MFIEIYQTTTGRRPFVDWLNSLADVRTQARVEARIRRLSISHWGDHKRLGDGITELRLDFGPGYRVYCSKVDQTLVILFVGGDKSSQRRNIETTRRYLRDYQERP